MRRAVATLSTLAVLSLATASARADTVAAQGPATPTQDFATVNKQIGVPFALPDLISDLNVIVSVPHDDSSQISIRLRHPDGTILRLAERVPGQGFFHAVFDDEATQAPSGTGRHTGSLLPHDQLSGLDGKPIAGIWLLAVEDFAHGGQGAIRSVSLAFNGMTFVAEDVPSSTQFPGAVSLLAVAPDFEIGDAELTLDLDDTAMFDIAVYLDAPSFAGTAKLYNHFGAQDGLHGSTFDDEAFQQIDQAAFGITGTGRWRLTTVGNPAPLSELDGLRSGGTWQLRVADDDPFQGGGSLDAWSLHLVPAGPCADVAAQASAYGAGLAGTLGVPTLDVVQTPALGRQLQLSVDNSSGVSQSVLLVVGLAPAAIPGKGGTLLVAPLIQVLLVVPPAGLQLVADLPAAAGLCGTHLYLQSLHADAGAPVGVAFSAGLDLTLGS